ncbi:MAG TPA: GntR family transcriptional regulator [Candidatus Saccharimonadales bacterium]|nr:GntR family transcriptional regulator [Candidatus Saccharimonadales bacterium]
MIIFRLSNRSGVPAYLQIVHQVQQAIQLGWLHEGDKLPTVKEVVGMVAVNPNTIVKAYKELEGEGLVAGRAGLGTFVIASATGPPVEVRQALVDKLDAWVAEARQAGLTDDSIDALYAAALIHKRRDTPDGTSEQT